MYIFPEPCRWTWAWGWTWAAMGVTIPPPIPTEEDTPALGMEGAMATLTSKTHTKWYLSNITTTLYMFIFTSQGIVISYIYTIPTKVATKSWVSIWSVPIKASYIYIWNQLQMISHCVNKTLYLYMWRWYMFINNKFWDR